MCHCATDSDRETGPLHRLGGAGPGCTRFPSPGVVGSAARHACLRYRSGRAGAGTDGPGKGSSKHTEESSTSGGGVLVVVPSEVHTNLSSWTVELQEVSLKTRSNVVGNTVQHLKKCQKGKNNSP